MSPYDAEDGSSTGIAMCHIALVIRERQMSGTGTKPTYSGCRVQVRLPALNRPSGLNVGSPAHFRRSAGTPRRSVHDPKKAFTSTTSNGCSADKPAVRSRSAFSQSVSAPCQASPSVLVRSANLHWRSVRRAEAGIAFDRRARTRPMAGDAPRRQVTMSCAATGWPSPKPKLRRATPLAMQARLLWDTARNRKNSDERHRRFQNWLRARIQVRKG